MKSVTPGHSFSLRRLQEKEDRLMSNENKRRIIAGSITLGIIILCWYFCLTSIFSITTTVSTTLVKVERVERALYEDGSVVQDGIYFTVEYSLADITYTDTYFYSTYENYGNSTYPQYVIGDTISHYVDNDSLTIVTNENGIIFAVFLIGMFLLMFTAMLSFAYVLLW
jgi:hypothetical protein